MPTTPTRLRNWAQFVREGTADLPRVADMLDHCAERFEAYEATIEGLHADVRYWERHASEAEREV